MLLPSNALTLCDVCRFNTFDMQQAATKDTEVQQLSSCLLFPSYVNWLVA
jgi:hypothetical protein